MKAILRDGTELQVGDEVTSTFNSHLLGKILVIEGINPWEFCESGAIVLAHLKDDPEKKVKGFQKEGIDLGPLGIDANWFKKLAHDTHQ